MSVWARRWAGAPSTLDYCLTTQQVITVIKVSEPELHASSSTDLYHVWISRPMVMIPNKHDSPQLKKHRREGLAQAEVSLYLHGTRKSSRSYTRTPTHVDTLHTTESDFVCQWTKLSQVAVTAASICHNMLMPIREQCRMQASH